MRRFVKFIPVVFVAGALGACASDIGGDVYVDDTGGSAAGPVASAPDKVGKKLKRLEGRLAVVEKKAVPSGTVAFFNSTDCPREWAEFVETEGRYIVGLRRDGTPGAVVGQPLKDQENRAVGAHVHGYADSAVNNTSAGAGKVSMKPYSGLDTEFRHPSPGKVTLYNSARKTGGAIGARNGTNAPYIQMKACIKK